jgi:hypothetical protein
MELPKYRNSMKGSRSKPKSAWLSMTKLPRRVAKLTRETEGRLVRTKPSYTASSKVFSKLNSTIALMNLEPVELYK